MGRKFAAFFLSFCFCISGMSSFINAEEETTQPETIEETEESDETEQSAESEKETVISETTEETVLFDQESELENTNEEQSEETEIGESAEELNISEESEDDSVEYESNSDKEWSSEGEAYAVCTNNELIFFRSNNTYSNKSDGTFTDINGNEYKGRVYCGFETADYGNASSVPWYEKRTSVVSVKVADDQLISPKSTAYWFNDYERMTAFNCNGFDTSKVTNMCNMFYGCDRLTSLDLRSFETSNVVSMTGMFGQCFYLSGLDISSFDTSNVTNMSKMFSQCTRLSSLDVSHFNTSNVTDMSYMFYDCERLNSLDVSHFNTSNVTNMSYMFYDCEKLKSLDVSYFDTSNVTSMYCTFSDCKELNSLDISNFDTSKVIKMDSMFSYASNLVNIYVSEKWNVKNVRYHSNMFQGCNNLPNFNSSYVDKTRAYYGGDGYLTYKPYSGGQDDPSISGFSTEKDGWSFRNSYDGFSYPDNYRIPAERYYEVFGEEILTAIKLKDFEVIKLIGKSWGGNCFGMSVSAVLYYLNKLDWQNVNNKHQNYFPAVNSYFDSLQKHNSPSYMYASTSPSDEIAKMIERYQVLCYGFNGGYRYDDSTADLLNNIDGSNHFYFNNPDVHGRFHHNPSGDYIRKVVEMINSSSEPLCIQISANDFVHEIVLRTDKKPVGESGGWIKYYVYDPNNPYLPLEYTQEFKKEPADYYINHIAEDRYIELNPDKNLWRYDGIVDKNCKTRVLGCDKSENVQYYIAGKNVDEKTGKVLSLIEYPECIFVSRFSTTDIPLSFDGNEPWRPAVASVARFLISPELTCKIYDQSGNVVLAVNEGIIAEKEDDIVKDSFSIPGAMQDGETGSSLRFIELKNDNYKVKLEKGSSFLLADNDSSIAMAADEDIFFECKDGISEVTFTPDKETAFKFKLQEAVSNFDYDSISGIGSINVNDNIAFSLKNKELNVDNGITDDGYVQMFVSNESDETDDYVLTINSDNDDIAVSDITNENEIAEIKEKRFIIDYNKLEIVPGENKTINATLISSDPIQKITWSSSDDSIAAVDQTGLITGVKPGLAIVTAETDNGFTASCKVTVKEEPENKFSLKLNTNSTELVTNEEFQLTATVEPSNAENKKVIWTSSDTGIAKVDQNGKVTALKYGKVTITATSDSDPSKTATCTIQTRFYDVTDSTQPYYKPVYWGADSGVVAGFNGGEYFGPDEDCTRAQFVTFLWRLAGKPAGTKDVSFPDVDPKANYFRAVKWAVSQGIIVGFKHDNAPATFEPDGVVTRGQVATMLWRFGGKKTAKTGANFKDVKSTDSIYRAVSWGQEAGFIKGYKSGEFTGQFRPNDSCLRQHIVTFLYRYARDVMKKKV